jgi:hypothetical protein
MTNLPTPNGQTLAQTTAAAQPTRTLTAPEESSAARQSEGAVKRVGTVACVIVIGRTGRVTIG